MTFRSNHAVALVSDQRDPQDREFAFSEADFQALAKLAYDRAGIVLSESKRNLVYSRLSRRLRALRLISFADYRGYLAKQEAEYEHFINSISTNLTKFFREIHHFEHLARQIAEPFAANRNANRLRIWSAGCSTGEEPYTIATVLTRAIPDAERRDVRILATDIDTDVLNRGATGRYPLTSLDDVPKAFREMLVGRSENAHFEVPEILCSLIRFRQLNLLTTWPFAGLFDAIFCRNVMIYFDNATKAALVDRFIDRIKPGGFLYIGHSESILGGNPRLQLMGRTMYRRIG